MGPGPQEPGGLQDLPPAPDVYPVHPEGGRHQVQGEVEEGLGSPPRGLGAVALAEVEPGKELKEAEKAERPGEARAAEEVGELLEGLAAPSATYGRGLSVFDP